MGRSAKFHKKVRARHVPGVPFLTSRNQVKKTAPSTLQARHQPVAAPGPAEQKKRAGLKSKAYTRKPGSEGHVLGGADYVDLLMGGRRKARQEAAKLPQNPV